MRVEVIDFDGSNGCYYSPVDLDSARRRCCRAGSRLPRPTPASTSRWSTRSRQQDDRELRTRPWGGRCEWTRRRQRQHARAAAPAAHLSPRDAGGERLLRRAIGTRCSSATSRRRADDAGSNLPGQTVFTCLSHDIVAHETTHALVHDIRRYFMEPTGPRHAGLPRGVRRHRGPLPALQLHGGAARPHPAHRRRALRADAGPWWSAAAPRRRRRAAGADPRGGGPAQRADGPRPAVRRGDGHAGRAAQRPRHAARPAPSSTASSSPTSAARSWWPPSSTRSSPSTHPHGRPPPHRAAPAAGRDRRELERRARGPAGRGGGQDGRALPEHVRPRPRLLPARSTSRSATSCGPSSPPTATSSPTTTAATARSSSTRSAAGHPPGGRALLLRGGRSVGSPRRRPAGTSPEVRGPATSTSSGTSTRAPDERTPTVVLHEFAERHARLAGPAPHGTCRSHPALRFHPVHRVGPDGQLRFQVVAELLQEGPASTLTGESADPHAYRGGVTLVLDGETGACATRSTSAWPARAARSAHTEFWHRWRRPRRRDLRRHDAPAAPTWRGSTGVY